MTPISRMQGQIAGLCCLEVQRCELVLSCPGMYAEKLNSDDLPALVKVENDPWPYLFGINHRALIESEIQSLTCLIYFQLSIACVIPLASDQRRGGVPVTGDALFRF